MTHLVSFALCSECLRHGRILIFTFPEQILYVSEEILCHWKLRKSIHDLLQENKIHPAAGVYFFSQLENLPAEFPRRPEHIKSETLELIQRWKIVTLFKKLDPLFIHKILN